MRLLPPRAPPRAASSEGGSRRPSVAEIRAGGGSRQVGAVTQKLRAAREFRVHSGAAARAADDGYSSVAPYVCSLGAPLLFTAPHGLKLTKGAGPAQSARNHARERYTSEIVIRLAAAYAARQAATAAVPSPFASTASAATAPAMASFMVWNYKTAAVGDPRNMDPNYLDRRTAANSPWHSCLHAWRAGFATAGASAADGARPCPELMHFDVHGKNDREDTMAVDIGIEAMYADGCLEPAAVNRLRAFLGAELRTAFAGRTARSGKSGRLLPITVDERPQLHGWWGRGTVMTLSHQAALLGATAVQLELPCAVRSLLNEDAALFDSFAAAIFNTYDALAAAARAGELRPREGWARDEDGGLYLARLGTADRPLAELAVTPQLGADGAAAMLADLKRADAGRVHGKSI